MKEIDKVCVKMQVAQETFTIKTLAPIYPLNSEKFTDPNYYEKNEISLDDEIKNEARVNNAIKPILF